jgi:hypothetical protein
VEKQDKLLTGKKLAAFRQAHVASMEQAESKSPAIRL